MKNNKKIPDEEVLQLADQIKILWEFIYPMNLEKLKEYKTSLSDSISTHQAIGILDPTTYEDKQEKARGVMRRLQALINMIEVVHETELETVKREKESKVKGKVLDQINNIL